MSDLDKYLNFAKDMAEAAGPIMKKYFLSPEREAIIKGDRTPVTLADTEINDLVIEKVKKHYPDHAVLGEEASLAMDSEYVWVCDPVDGTLPFTHGLPISSFNLALTHKGKTLVAVQNDPFMGRLYTTKKGGGAFLNGQKIQVSGKFFGRIPINMEIYTSTFLENGGRIMLDSENALLSDKFTFMRLVSVGYSVGLVASGELAAAVFSGPGPYEAAVANLLITEAGGKFTNLYGGIDPRYDQKTNGFIAAHPNIHKIIQQLLAPALKKAKHK